MKPSKIICFLIALALLICATSCDKPAEDEKPSDFDASVSLLCDTMAVDREDAVDILEVLCSLGLDAKIDSIYAATDGDGASFYKVWFGLNLLCVYLEDGKVTRVLRYGEVIYPESSEGNEGESKPDGPSDEPSSKTNEIELVSMTSRLRAGDEARIEVVGDPDTVYEITVRYSSGASSAKGLEPKCSDSEGRVSWTWKVSANVLPGEYSIEITSGVEPYKTTFIVE